MCLVPQLLKPETVEELNKNLNSINSFKNPKALIFEIRQGKFFERSGFGFSDVHLVEKNKEMNFKVILPFFYLLKFIKTNEYPLLDEIMLLFIEFLCKSSNNQT